MLCQTTVWSKSWRDVTARPTPRGHRHRMSSESCAPSVVFCRIRGPQGLQRLASTRASLDDSRRVAFGGVAMRILRRRIGDWLSVLRRGQCGCVFGVALRRVTVPASPFQSSTPRTACTQADRAERLCGVIYRPAVTLRAKNRPAGRPACTTSALIARYSLIWWSKPRPADRDRLTDG